MTFIRVKTRAPGALAWSWSHQQPRWLCVLRVSGQFVLGLQAFRPSVFLKKLPCRGSPECSVQALWGPVASTVGADFQLEGVGLCSPLAQGQPSCRTFPRGCLCHRLLTEPSVPSWFSLPFWETASVLRNDCFICAGSILRFSSIFFVITQGN